MAIIAAYNSSVLVTAQPSIPTTNEATSTSDLTTFTVSTAAHRYFDPTATTTVQENTGSGYVTITTGFTLYHCPARVVFATAQPGGTTVRFSVASYFAYSTMAEASAADFQPKMTMDDVTVFNSSGAKSFLPTLLEGTLKLITFWLSNTRASSLLARDLLVVSFVTASGNRYEGFCYGSDMDIKFDPKKAIAQDITFQLANEFFNA